MDGPEYTIVINDSFVRTYKADQNRAVRDAIDDFEKYNDAFTQDYRNATEEEKKMYSEDIEDILSEAGDIKVIRVYRV